LASVSRLDATADPPAPRVTPRKRATNADRPIIAASVAYDRWTNESGDVGTLAELSPLLRTILPSIIACDHSAELLAYLHERYRFDPQWQFRVTPLERTVFQPSARPGALMTQTGTLVNFFGWRMSADSSRNVPNLYHLCIDPITFSNFQLHRGTDVTVVTCNSEGEDSLAQLMQWARDLRAFCMEQLIDLKSTQGATARQFLRDPRFYPEPRRKIPRATNERVRLNLPGNEYVLKVPEAAESSATYPECLYIDQGRAHHSHAAKAAFPNADTLNAYGNFHADSPPPWRSDPRRISDFILPFHGMILGELEYTGRSYHWRPSYLDTGRPVVWYSTDTDILATLKVRCKCIYAAWGSTEQDLGLNAYAEWAIDRLGSNPPLWLKTLLLSTYGTLATRARQYSFGYAQSDSDKVHPETIRAGRSEFIAMMFTTKHDSEPSTNNVLHRGLIEAATRTESLVLANHLARHGWQTLAIYADALIVRAKADREPELYAPWTIKERLHNVQFISSNAFISDEMRKVPGGLDRRQRTALSRASFASNRRQRGPVGRLMMGMRNA